MVKVKSILKWSFLGLVLLFIYFPIIFLTVNSFNESDIIPISKALEYMPTKVVYGFLETKVRNGVPLFLGEDDLLFVKNDKDEPLAIYKKEEDGKHHSLRGLF